MFIISQIDRNGFYTGVALESDVCPIGFVLAAPPQPQSGMIPRWIGGQWGMLPAANKAGFDLAALKGAAIVAVQTKFAQIIAAGFSTGGVHVAIDGESRANLSGMAATALAVSAKIPGITWPASYQSWWSIEGTPIPIPAPADGLAFAAAAGIYYSQAVVHEATLVGEIEAAADAATLGAIDIDAGWPAP